MRTNVPRIARAAVCALAVLLFSGCSSAPTDRDVARGVLGAAIVAAPIGAAVLAGYSKSGW